MGDYAEQASSEGGTPAPQQTKDQAVAEAKRKQAELEASRPPRPEGMSKNAYKKMIRDMEWEKKKGERKQKRKLKAEAAKKRKRERIEAGDLSVIKLRKSLKKTSDNEASSVRIAIDMSFEEYMIDKDLVKLTKQVERCYSQNRRAQHPIQYYITGFQG